MGGVQRCCSHVATESPKDSNPYLISVATNKKPVSRFTKKGYVQFKVDAWFYLVGHGVQHERRLLASISLREGSSL